MSRWLLLTLLHGCGASESDEYCEYADIDDLCPAEVVIEAQLEGTEQCLSGGRALVLEVTGEALEGSEERVYDEAREIWVLARRCCYALEVRPTDEPCSEE